MSSVCQLTQLVKSSREEQSQNPASSDDSQRIGLMIAEQHRQLNNEQKRFFFLRIQQAYVEALQYSAEDADWASDIFVIVIYIPCCNTVSYF